MDNTLVNVLYFPENGAPSIKVISCEDPKGAQELVEGDFTYMRLKDGLLLGCNEDAIRLEMEPNRVVPPALSGWFDPWRSTIRGPFFIQSDDEVDLTPAQIKYLVHAFGETLEESREVE